MLEGGGNPYVGMLYAMNNRYGWGVYNADRIYRIWDAFGIQQAQMLGYWHSKCPIRTDHPEVLVTVYQKPDALLAVAYNFSEKAQSFHYEIDLERLPFRPGRKEPVRLYAKEWRKIKRATNLGGIQKGQDIGIDIHACGVACPGLFMIPHMHIDQAAHLIQHFARAA